MKALDWIRTGIGTTATVLAAVLGVVFLLVPSWKPLSRDKIGASVSVPVVEEAVRLDDWAQRQYGAEWKKVLPKLVNPKHPEIALRQTTLESKGLVAYVRLETEGFKRRHISLRAEIYDSANSRPFRGRLEVVYPKSGRTNIDAPSRSSVQLLFLPDLVTEGTYFVRVEAYDGDGILAYADSKPIVIVDTGGYTK
jgi:hypothetical protein